MIDSLATDLSRLQFALTALYHFLFVPLTLGLSFILAIMESVYVLTGKEIWRRMTQFWGILFGINFAMGVATGITMEFQFGTNWSYYSHYVGDIFGSLLAIEGLMAFFLEATFIGLFFFGWKRLSKRAHLTVTWFLALGTNFSALWILIANAWMQDPVGSMFNPDSMRMEITSFHDVFFNPIAQSKFFHTVSAGYVTGAMFVFAISAYYMLRNRHLDIAKRSMAVAASFGLIASLCVVVLGDESGYEVAQKQQMKLAAIEGLWNTEPAPAGFTVIGFPDVHQKKTHFEVKIPWALGILATRSFSTEIPGINELVEQAKTRIENGIIAYDALKKYKETKDEKALSVLKQHQHDFGHALLLKKVHPQVIGASPEHIQKAAELTIPNIPVIFWSFRIMMGLGFFLIIFFVYAFYLSCKKRLQEKTWFLKLALFALPTPWIAIELGWIVAEYGRQPWSIQGVLPTFLASSSLSASSVMFTIVGFVVFYTALLVVDMILMTKYIRLGPDNALKSA